MSACALCLRKHGALVDIERTVVCPPCLEATARFFAEGARAIRDAIWTSAPTSTVDLLIHDELNALDPHGVEKRRAMRLLRRSALRVQPSAALKVLRAALFPE